ncbi:uncharacterized protein ASPGLDRAFT_1331033 [Aspergillus glaucus CBS 516.65]|uniref:Uncharacterized protein n=1 Tax=Aspergillus glaucus CBS 516.65 TaxID=1160497 RepID=A0A1L9VQN2_ASPGL|nr:hypothetical protein ASPGLDRAFT_1331033 [Aspergillus glaucus CBS 516.65]OJJ86219.1 hypothetical protein ASPGLDRAFT_1331033 [Aspergillus glaucus CBS 516.65]
MTIIFTAVAVSEPEMPTYSAVKYKDKLINTMSCHGIKYTNIQPAMVPGQIQKQNDDEPVLLERFLIKGLVGPTSNTSHDVYHYSGGATVFHLPLQGAGVDNTVITGLNKRDSHHGFGVSFTTHGKSALSREERELMTTAIGSYWAGLAHATSMVDYIGLGETGHTANFYFRIVP